MRIMLSEIEAFVRNVDEHGGPERINELYPPGSVSFEVDTAWAAEADPFSESYVEKQLQLYTEISGRAFNQECNELTLFDHDGHYRASNPYGLRDVSRMAKHFATLSRSFILADLPVSPSVLDMGCGWGLSSELLAYLGADVCAVDINERFVNLVSARAKRLALPISAQKSSFENFRSHRKFDMALFYECLHHSLRVWTVLAIVSKSLKHAGVVVLAGEPIQNIWWKHWGLRLDPLSVYCIRKFGWFESGWSREFLSQASANAGFHIEYHTGSSLGEEPICILRKVGDEASDTTDAVGIITSDFIGSGWLQEGDYWISGRNCHIKIPENVVGRSLVLEIWNYRGKSIKVEFSGASQRVVTNLVPGQNEVWITAVEAISIVAETWNPSEELGYPDDREISFHLKEIRVDP